MTIRTVLLSLQALMCSPEPNDPQDAQVAKQYKTDFKAFEKQAAEWTQKYGTKGLTIEEQETKIQNLIDLGFKRDIARAELVKNGWDLEGATNSLLDQ
jgi:ubiquitin-conjugating enzyme (huntingtin interacting protein 2)